MPTDTHSRALRAPRRSAAAGPGFATARHEMMRFLRRLALLIAVVAVLVLGGAAALRRCSRTSPTGAA